MNDELLNEAASAGSRGAERRMFSTRWPARFRTTRWSLILAVGDGGDGRRQALGHLYRIYWQPLFSLFARHRGQERAGELTQAFFVARLLESDDLKGLEPLPGRRFRRWLSVAASRFLMNEWKFQRRQRRDVRRTLLLGGAREDIAERALRSAEPNPEQRFRRAQVLALLSEVLERLRHEYCSHASRAGAENAAQRFEAVKRFLPGPETEGADYADTATDLGLSRDAVKQLVCQLRKRYGQLLHDEIRKSVDADADVPAARRALYRAL